MTAAHTTTGRKAGKGLDMSTITVNLAGTEAANASAIKANGGPLFRIRITCQADPAGRFHGFGKVVCEGPVKGYEVLYTLESVVA